MANEHYIQDDFPSCLGRFVEEAGEALSAAGKTQRFGPWSANPELPPAERVANIDWLRAEAADLQDAAARLIAAIDREPRQPIKPGMRAPMLKTSGAGT